MQDASLYLFSNLEFHRSGIGLLPEPHDPDPGLAVHLANVPGSQRPLTFCSCTAGRRSRCAHLRNLREGLRDYAGWANGRSWVDILGKSHWLQLAQLLYQGQPIGIADVEVVQESREGPLRIHVHGEELVRYMEQSPSTVRLLERLGKAPAGRGFADRAGLLERLGTFLRSPEEQHLNKAGMRTNRQSFEDSFWWRFAYHCFRDIGDAVRFRPAIERRSGNFTLEVVVESTGEGAGENAGEDGSTEPIAQLVVPRAQVGALLEGAEVPIEPTVEPVLSSTFFHVVPETRMVDEIRPHVQFLVAYGEEILDAEERQRFRYGDIVFLEELSALLQIDRDPNAWQRPDPRSLDLTHAAIGSYTTDELPSGKQARLFLEDPMSDLGIFTDYDYMEMVPDEDEETELTLAIRYGFGEDEVSLGDLLRAKKSGQPYLQTESGWIDLNAPSLRGLTTLLRGKELGDRLRDGEEGNRVRLSSAELLRLRAGSAKPIRVEVVGDRSEFLERFLQLRPAKPLVLPTGLHSTLREYQVLGLEWLKFLYENRLAGLLCDDMGLGKTHQAMALMVLLREQFGVTDPFLVVCPRTVISHWRNKLREHAPGLRPVQHHGPQRNLERCLEEGDVVLTSYGVLRNDIDKLQPLAWGLTIFDEVQQIKNRATQGYRAAASVPSRMKLGMTGTPIENSLTELKALFDLILPGYLGSEDDFRDRYGASLEGDVEDWHLSNLRRLTAPFVLRRVKSAVLDELPAKIEDVRTCTLGAEQLQLYRSTIATKGVALMNRLKSGHDPLPYIHIFALLNMLKQICDHPALALGQVEQYRDFESGKWELFQELLAESLDSGQKVVVFTQYLGMIAILKSHVEELGIPYVTLTGASRNRGDIVDRFNNDPETRVFLGSLKAGGTGIDLIGGSVVIHYDRWWNAAREDQATDRLYRIGQKRVVQVFKLVTENTLEERIAAIIDRKRQLMSSVVQADDPKLNKIFTREELIELLEDPE